MHTDTWREPFHFACTPAYTIVVAGHLHANIPNGGSQHCGTLARKWIGTFTSGVTCTSTYTTLVATGASWPQSLRQLIRCHIPHRKYMPHVDFASYLNTLLPNLGMPFLRLPPFFSAFLRFSPPFSGLLRICPPFSGLLRFSPTLSGTITGAESALIYMGAHADRHFYDARASAGDIHT